MVGIFQAREQKASGLGCLFPWASVSTQVLTERESEGTSRPAAPWPMDGATAGFTRRSHPREAEPSN